MHNTTVVVSLLLVCGSCRTADPGAGSRAPSAPQEEITVEWIYGPQGRALDRVPSFAWRADGRAILWDDEVDPPTLELFDPATRARTPLVDREKALAGLGAWPDVAADEAWRWPEAFDEAGARALYLTKGDVFVLDLASSTFRRLTQTPQEEKSASFSPDGRRVAFVRDNDLYAVDVVTGDEARLTIDGSDTILNGTLSWVYWEEIFGRHDTAYWWSDDSRSIAYLQTDESPVGTVRFVAFEEPYPEVITQRYPKAGSANPLVRVGVVSVAIHGGGDEGGGGATTWVELPEPYEYVARVKWLPDGRRLAVQTMPRDQRRLDLFLAEPGAGPARKLLTETDEAWVDIHDDLYFLEDGEHFLWASERSGFAHLYLYTLDGELVRQVTSGDWAIASSGGGVSWLRQAVCAIDEERGWIYYTGQEESSVERHLYRIRFDGSGRERLSGAAGNHRITFDPHARTYFDRYSSLGALPALAVYRADGSLLSEVMSPSPERLARLGVQVPELIEVPARDGFRMPAWILKPADFDPSRRYPLILYVYGGPSAPTVANAWSNSLLYDQVLLRNGYLVARCDNRASTAISKDLERTVLLRLAGDVERDDYVDAARWFKALPYVDPDRVGIWGWSGGGSMTLLMLTRSDEFAAGIAVAPVTDWAYYDTKWAEYAMKRPQDNPEGYAYTSIASRAKDLHGRLLLVHGTYDDNVHPQNTWRFVDELVAASIPFDLMIYPMRKHGISDSAARIHLFNKMTEFWRLYL